MKRTIKFVLGFAVLGALPGVGMAVWLGTRGETAFELLPDWILEHLNPMQGLLVFFVSCGLYLGALTGLASAFSRGRFATVRCLLTISIPAYIAMAFVPWRKGEGYWRQHLVGAVVALATAILLAFVGHHRARRRLPAVPATSGDRV
jgi:hypothetical protein